MRFDHTLPLLAILLVGGCGGGGSAGGGSTGPTGGVAPTPPPSTPSAAPTSGSGPTIAIDTSTRAGRAPLEVSFGLCGSRDGSGGQALTYLADFEGEGLTPQSGCGFSHRYTSNGVSVWDSRLCVRDSAGRDSCESITIKAYIGFQMSVDQTTGCQSTVIATATELRSAANGLHALAELDKVVFEAFTVTGRSLGSRDGTRSGQNWRSGTWNVNSQEKLRVIATGFARGVAGDDVPEGERPACNP